MNEKNAFSLLSQEIIEKLSEQNISKPSNVQNEVIPLINEGKNLIFQSETGTGKTYAYLLPLINKLQQDSETQKLRILIVAPTFELASQINTAAKAITNRKTALIIGGAPIKRQLELLKEKPQIITGTTARIIELIRLKKIKLNDLSACIFDECDRMIKKEAYDDTYELKSLLPQNTQIIALSATISPSVKKFFNGIDSLIMPDEDILQKNISHWAIFAERRDKIETLRKFLAAEKCTKALVFTSRADQVENIYSKLSFKKVPCIALHAKAKKQERKAAIDKFRSGKINVMITSDLCARGLDIPNITHVIQMDIPSDDDFFIHRSGRTGRAGKTGINLVIGDEFEMRQYAALEKKLGLIVYPKELYNGKVVAPQVFDEEENI